MVVDGPVEPVGDRSHRSPVLSFDDWATDAGPGLLRFAVVVSGSPHAAADIVQDALIAVYPRWSKLSAAGTVDAYARRVIMNRQISWWRKWGRRERPTESLDLYAAVEDQEPPRTPDVAIASEVLATLPARHRAAIMLRFYDDLAYAEMAEILGCTESTARSYVHRALVKLRLRLEEVDHD